MRGIKEKRRDRCQAFDDDIRKKETSSRERQVDHHLDLKKNNFYLLKAINVISVNVRKI